LSNVEWRATKAYIFAPASRTIYINRSDVVPEAPISPGTEHDELCEQIKAAFEAVIDPESGKQVFLVKRIPHIWQGPFIDEIAPDLILEILDDRYFLQMSDPRGRLFWNEEPGALGGAHRYIGLALFKGEGIRAGTTLPTAGILDVVPTLLYLMGIALPQNLDGKVIEGAIEPSYLKTHPIQIEPEPRPELYRPELEAGYSQEELESVMQKFRALGYVE
jgi:predicted AlkP superfamily phosphohydrolase/phosphomutase